MPEEMFRLDQETYRVLVDRAWSDFPYEVCGLLGLRSDGSIVHFPVTNAERSMTYYVMDGKELLQAMRTIEDEGWRLAIYHSHTHTEAFPSRTDVELAAYPDALHLIVSLQDREKPEVRAFRIVEGRISEVPLVIDDVAA
ncbi:MAG: Mov34/MPN/PAD-1 family protein [Nitriliruptorales bacterium]